MGFTIYWVRQPVSHETFERFKTLLPDLLEYSTAQTTVTEVVLVPTDNEGSPERFWTRETSSGFAFAKTSRTPYTTDVMRACILMAELGMVTLEGLSNDDAEAFPWTLELEAVNRYVPLTTYAKQMVHFLKSELNDILEKTSIEERIAAVQIMLKALRESKGSKNPAVIS